MPNYTWFLAPIAGMKLLTQATQPGGIGSLESILGFLKSLKIRAQFKVTARHTPHSPSYLCAKYSSTVEKTPRN